MDKPFVAWRGAPPYTFVCYAHADAQRVYPLIAYLHEAGARLWYDEGIPPGDSWRAEISERLEAAGSMLLFLSQAALDSAHCRREIDFALDTDTRIVPVLLEDLTLPAELRMGLGRVQMIVRSAHGVSAFRERLADALAIPASHVAATPARPAGGRLWAALAACLVLAAGITWLVGPWGTPAVPQSPVAEATPKVMAAATPRSVAVLPFVNLSSDPDQAYFADGIAEELLNRLARNPELRVTSRTSAFSFRDAGADLATIAATLGVAHIVEGSVRRAGETLRISAQLVEVAGDRQLWADSYDRTLDDVLAVQDEIAGSVARALEVNLLGAPVARYAPDPVAQRKFLQARQLLDRYETATRPLAKRLLDEAIAIDPLFTGPWRELARCHIHSYLDDETYDRREASALAAAALNRALEIDPEDAEALGILAWLRANFDQELAQAGRLFTRALDIDPANISTLKLAVDMALVLQRMDEAVRIARYVVARDPLCILCHQRLVEALYWSGRYGEVEAHDRVYREIQGLSGVGYHGAMSRLRLGNAAAALHVFDNRDMRPYADWAARHGRVVAMYRLGHMQAFEVELAKTESYALQDGDMGAEMMASVLMDVGRTDEAFAWLGRLDRIDWRTRLAMRMGTWNDDPRWEAILERFEQTPEQLAAVEFNYTLPPL